MTYYGRRTYKYEIAAQKGAAAAIIVHETIPAAYPWTVVENSNTSKTLRSMRQTKNMGTVGVRSWMTLETARQLFSAAGQDFDSLKRLRCVRISNRLVRHAGRFHSAKPDHTYQVTQCRGEARGKRPQRKDEYVVYSAHWDHLGRDKSLKGDQIYNGALDNASGVASLLEIAQAFIKLPQSPHAAFSFSPPPLRKAAC